MGCYRELWVIWNLKYAAGYMICSIGISHIEPEVYLRIQDFVALSKIVGKTGTLRLPPDTGF